MNSPAVGDVELLPVGRAASASPWQWSQTWRNLLFLHWQVPEARLRALLPGELELDRWDGEAWVSAVAFRLAIRLRGLPPIPLCSNFLELNLRTYVRYRGEPGVCFLSMHANSALAVTAARWLTPLPYRYAPMSCDDQHGRWRWRCGGASAAQHALLDGRFEVQSEPAPVAADSLDAWLLERYRAFVADRRGRLFRMRVEHAPWQVSAVTSNMAAVSSEPSVGINLSRESDRSHFSAGLEAHIWPFESLHKPDAQAK